MSKPAISWPEASDAGFFESLLTLERTANEQSPLPAPLLELIATLLRGIDQEGIEAPGTKPNILQRTLIAAIGMAPSAIAFEQRNSAIHNIIVLEQATVVFFAGFLLGQTRSVRVSAPSRIEMQIVLRFFAHYFSGFSLMENLQNSVSWSSYMAAALPLTKTVDGPVIMILANRREEAAPHVAPVSAGIKQQQQLRRTITNGLIDVEYVLNAGQLPLATLHNLKPGSVLALPLLADCHVEARANGTPVLNGTLRFAADQMRISVTKFLAGDAASK